MPLLELSVLALGWVQIAVGVALTPSWFSSGHFFSTIGAATFQMFGQGAACLWWAWLQNKWRREDHDLT